MTNDANDKNCEARRNDEPEGQVSARRALIAIGETIGQQCSICRSRHGSEVRHACE
jgi:hypothetical protein